MAPFGGLVEEEEEDYGEDDDGGGGLGGEQGGHLGFVFGHESSPEVEADADFAEDENGEYGELDCQRHGVNRRCRVLPIAVSRVSVASRLNGLA